MNESISIVSFVPSKGFGDRAYFAAMKITQGKIPQYFYSSVEANGDYKHFIELGHRVKSLLNQSTIFVFNNANGILNKFSGIEMDVTEVIDVKDLLTIFYPSLSNSNLEELCSKVGVNRKGIRQSPAKKEVRLLWELLKNLWNKGLEFDLSYINTLEEYCKGLSFARYLGLLKKEIIKQFPDKPIQLGMKLNGNDLDLFTDKDIERDNFSIPPDWVKNCFEQDGLLANNFPGFETRSSQGVMADAIIEGFTGSTNIIIEAGTGTGKSIAYLIPALWWAKKNKNRVVIATHTINLQDQLYNKDIPFLQKILPFDFRSALLKGKNNYICLKNLNQNRMIEELSTQERIAIVGLYTWTRETISGDISEMSFLPNFSSLWSKFGGDNGYCQPGDCSFTKDCFLFRARKKAEEADIIIVNHSLLFADIKTNNKIIPEYSNLIIDEAHNIYQTALKQLGFEISSEHIVRIIENILGSKGSLVSILKKNRPYWSEIFPIINWEDFYKLLDQLPEICDGIMEQSKELFGLCQGLLADRINIRVNEMKIGKNAFDFLTVSIENLTFRLRNLVEVLSRLYSLLTLENEHLENIRYEINRIKNEINQILEGLNRIITTNDETRVTYIEKSGILYLKDTSVDITGILKEKIFDLKRSTILTSATLTVDNSFEYFARDIGLDRYKSLSLNSPFDFDSQMLFCIVNDIPMSKGIEDTLVDKVSKFIKQVGETMNGRTLVLFTSHRFLRQVYHLLHEQLVDSDLNILAQGMNGTRESLLKDFMNNSRGILLGTNSFWEGIDIPGDDLRCVIMTKLPFWPPDTPILEAKANLIETQGGDSFKHLHLPEAVIRFKQGFGRLIRSKNDSGVVILLDERILNKKYGKTFIKSLPILSYFQGSSEKVISQVKRWV